MPVPLILSVFITTVVLGIVLIVQAFGMQAQQQLPQQAKMMVWSDLVHATLIAKTKGTFDAINTNAASVVISKPDARAILGLIVSYGCITTDAENLPDLFIQINSKALGISNEVLTFAAGGNDADANNEYTYMISKFFPYKIKAGFEEKLYNAAITFKAAPSVTNSGGLDVVVSVVYANQEPDPQFAMELLAQMHGRVEGGDADGDAAKAFATGGAAVTLTSLTIPAGTRQLRGLLGKMNPNAIVAAKSKVGFIEFIAPGIKDFSPQKWPLCIAWNAALGTVAESAGYSAPGRFYPTRFPLPGAEITVQIQMTITIAATTAPDTTQAIIYE